MVRYKGTATFKVNDTDYVFTGRTVQTIADGAVKSFLLGTGCFTEDGSGDLFYSAAVSVVDDSGNPQAVDTNSELPGALTDFDDNASVVEAI